MLCAGHSGAYKQLCWSSTQRVTGSNSLCSRPKGFSRAGKAAKPPQHPSGQRSQLPLSPARFPRLLPSRSQCAAAPNEFSGKQIKGRGYITQQTAQPAPGCAGKPCLGFLGCATLLAAAAGKPAAPTRTRCSNNLIKAAQYRWLLSDGQGRARAPGNLPLLRGFLGFFPPVQNHRQTKPGGSKGDSSGCCGSAAEVSGVRKFQSRQPGLLLVRVQGGQGSAGGDGTFCLLGNHPQLGWVLLVTWALTSSLHSPIAAGSPGRNHHPSIRCAHPSGASLENPACPQPFLHRILVNKASRDEFPVHSCVRAQQQLDQHQDGDGNEVSALCPGQRDHSSSHLGLCKTFSHPFSPQKIFIQVSSSVLPWKTSAAANE